MATVAISALPATNTVDATTVAPVVYSGSTYKATLTTLGAFINTNAATVSATGNITGGNLRTGGVVSATGNVTGNYILGNGALLTGVITSVANINSGTSNVTVVSSGGNVTVGIGGTSNVAVFATTGEYVTGVVSASGNVTGGNLNAAGLSLSSNVVSALNSTSNITTTANVSGGNVLSDGAVSATGNITGGNILGGANVNATTHTGTTVSVSGNITGGNLNAAGLSLSSNVVSAINSTSAINTTGNVLGGNLLTGGAISAASVSASGNITGGNINAAGLSLSSNVVSALNVTGAIAGANVTTPGLISATGNITGGNVTTGGLTQTVNLSVSGNVLGSLLPSANVTYDLGSATQRWKDLYLSGTTIQLGGATLSASGTALSVGTGNVTGGNVTTGGLVTATGNITGGNLNAAGLSLSSNVVSTLNVTANIAGGNVRGSSLTGNVVSVSGNITGGNIIGIIAAGSNAITTTGDITGGNLITGAAVSAASVSASGNITGGNLNAAGLSLSSNVVSALNVTANIAGGNVTTPGLISAAGNITGGNVNTTSLTGTTVSITGNISAGNISLSGNTTPGNLLTGGIVSATGNVTGGNIIGTTAVVVPTVRNTAALTISTSAGNLNLSPTGNIVINNTYINGVSDPVQNQDVATKAYVDTYISSGIAYHSPVAAATTTTLASTTGGTISYTQPNGAGNGIGALLTTTGAFNLIDTANVQTVGTRILVKNEANAVYNGVYTWANATNIIRATDADEYGPDSVTALSINDYFFTSGGNVNAGSAFVVSAPSGTITFGTSNITFSTFSTSQVYSANTAAGVSLNGTVINAKVDGTTTAFDGSGNISVKASANLTTPNIGAATGTSLSVTGNITGGNINASKIFNGASQVNVISSGGNISIITGGDPAATFSFSNGLEMLTGNISTAGNVISGNLRTGGLISATGNVNAAGLSLSANVVSALNVTGNIAGANITTPGLMSSTGNATHGNLNIASGGKVGVGTATPDSAVTILATPQTVVYPITGNSTTEGTDIHISGSNSTITRITQDAFGTSNYPAFTGRSSRGTAAAPTQTQSSDVLNQFTARGFSNGTLQFGNASTGRLDVVAAENFTDTSRATKLIVYTTPTGAILPVATATFDSTGAFSASGNITGGNVLGGANVNATLFTGTTVSVTGNITGGNLNAAGLSLSSNVVSALNVTGNIAGGNVTTPGLISATGNISSQGNLSIGNVSASGGYSTTSGNYSTTSGTYSTTSGNHTTVTGLISAGGNVTGGNLLTGGLISATGAITGAAITGTSLTVSTGNITGGNIVNAGANGVGNIGNATTYFNTVFAKATSAQYADLAEKYTADAEYTSGTVLSFGGAQEVTVTLIDADHRVAGVVSTNPATIMNAGLIGEHVATVALTGRVPCSVTGTVRKGDSMVSAGNGAARAETNPAVSTVIGKSLEDFDGESGMIEIVVGRV